MFQKYLIIFTIFFLSLVVHGQDVVNDCGSRISVSVQKKINDQFTVFGKVQGRLAENFRLFNRVYFRVGLDYNLNDHLTFTACGNYMLSRGGFKEMDKSYRYSAAVTYKTKLTELFSISNKLMYQNTEDYVLNSDIIKQKTSGVIRNKTSLKYKINRRGSAYISEELLWQISGKKEKYFGRNRVYLGYIHKINAKLEVEPYFILERTFNKANGPQTRTFYYCVNFGYSF